MLKELREAIAALRLLDRDEQEKAAYLLQAWLNRGELELEA